LNVQTIPRDDKVVKAAFRPKQDAFLFFDYPNIELKLLAYYLNRIEHPSMGQVFRDGADLHLVTAAGLHNIDPDKLASEYIANSGNRADLWRQEAKRVNFSIVYGGGVPTLMEQLGLDAPGALNLLRNYHNTWPGIGWATKKRPADPGTLAWWIQKRVKERGYITTLWGRHLHPHSPHVALNALCQGCAADLMKWALVNVNRWLQGEGLRSHLVNVVHDELMLDVVTEEIPTLVKHIPDLMTWDALEAVVPIRPEPDISFTTWAGKEPYGVDGAADVC